MVLIILEGTDRSGKSTLASYINTYLHNIYPQDTIKMMHAGPPRYHPLDEYEIPFIRYRPATGHHIICDRWHIGEMVYPEVMNRPSAMDISILHHIEAFLLSRGAILIYVSADEDILKQRFDKEIMQGTSSIVSWDQLRFTQSLFTRSIRKSMLPSSNINTSLLSYTDSTYVRTIADLALCNEEQTSHLNKYVTYIGASQPRILFYDHANRVGPYRRTHMHNHIQLLPHDLYNYLPSFIPIKGTGSKYFFNFIYDVVGHTNVGFMNANDIDDPYDAWNDLGKPNAIAVGQSAWNTVHTWANGAIPHPHTVQRITYNCTQQYKKIIAQTITHGGNNIRKIHNIH